MEIQHIRDYVILDTLTKHICLGISYNKLEYVIEYTRGYGF